MQIAKRHSTYTHMYMTKARQSITILTIKAHGKDSVETKLTMSIMKPFHLPDNVLNSKSRSLFRSISQNGR